MPEAHCSEVAVNLSAVIVAFENNSPMILILPPETIKEYPSLPYGSFYPTTHRTLEQGLIAWVKSRTGLELGYVEQLYTFGNLYRRQPLEEKNHRLLTVSYLALTYPSPIAAGYNAQWRKCYDFFPWEDHRKGRPKITNLLLEKLYEWADEAPDKIGRLERLERIQFAFGGDKWNPDRTLVRYELLYESALVSEAARDWNAWPEKDRDKLPIKRKEPISFMNNIDSGLAMAHDHRRILASAIGRLRGKLQYRPLVFELLPEKFTLLYIQKVMEALQGTSLHKQNFRRLLLSGDYIKETGEIDRTSHGRPASLYQFRKNVHFERQQSSSGHVNG